MNMGNQGGITDPKEDTALGMKNQLKTVHCVSGDPPFLPGTEVL